MCQKEVIPAGNEWKTAPAGEFTGSPFTRIGGEWMLITAAGDLSSDKGAWNTMTASWGALGVLWGMDVAMCFIRPSRRTIEFANSSALFSLSFFPPKYKDALNVCGTESGRDIDKAAKTGLTPIVFENGEAKGAVGFREASETFVCKKLYIHDFDPARFIVPDKIEKNYPEKDYHRMFIGQILELKTR